MRCYGPEKFKATRYDKYCEEPYRNQQVSFAS